MARSMVCVLFSFPKENNGQIKMFRLFLFFPNEDSQALESNGFKCGITTTYVPMVYVCDGHLDCSDGSDETDKACTSNGAGKNLFAFISFC